MDRQLPHVPDLRSRQDPVGEESCSLIGRLTSGEWLGRRRKLHRRSSVTGRIARTRQSTSEPAKLTFIGQQARTCRSEYWLVAYVKAESSRDPKAAFSRPPWLSSRGDGITSDDPVRPTGQCAVSTSPAVFWIVFEHAIVPLLCVTDLERINRWCGSGNSCAPLAHGFSLRPCAHVTEPRKGAPFRTSASPAILIW